jgi:hypothetical protein
MSSKIRKHDKQIEILETLLQDLDQLKPYEQYDEKIARERQPKENVFHNKDLTSQIFDFLSEDDIKKNETEEKKKYRYESLKNMFKHHKPTWLITRNPNYGSPDDSEFHIRERILGYYNEYQKLERELYDFKEENRKKDFLLSISNYGRVKSKTKRGGVRRKQTKRKYSRKVSNK